MNVNKESILMERSIIGINQNPPINEMGIPRDIQKASFGFKNNAKTIRTRNNPYFALSVNRSILPCSNNASSFHGVI